MLDECVTLHNVNSVCWCFNRRKQCLLQCIVFIVYIVLQMQEMYSEHGINTKFIILVPLVATVSG